ncbi:MAG TPA: GAF domain-containing protein [Anaerolineae bacterium]|nr:GAF domain-containing protein [Anaerolineae bacterium]
MSHPFDLLAGTADVLVAHYAPFGACTYVSANVKALLGYEVAAYQTRPWLACGHQDDMDKIQLMLTVGVDHIVEERMRLKRADGGYGWFDVRGQYVEQSDTFEEGLLIVARVVSEAQQKAREDELQQKRSWQVRQERVQIATEIAYAIVTAEDMRGLYEQVVEQIGTRFDYYYVQMFRHDANSRKAILAYGLGEVGDKLVAEGHEVGPGIGLVGQVLNRRKSILRADLTAEEGWQPDPLLPESKGQLVIPVKWKDELLAIVDIHSNEKNQFTQDAQLVFEGLATQIATVIESMRLRQEMVSQLAELNTMQQQISHQGWAAYMEGMEAERRGYLYGDEAVEMLPVADLRRQGGHEATLAVRGEPIGLLGLVADDVSPLTADDVSLIESISGQVAEALESARLFEQTQQALAQQEKLTSELETVSHVSINAATILEQDLMLESVVNLAQERFGFSYIQIYTMEEESNSLVLKAASGELGKILLQETTKIPLKATSIVARCALSKEVVRANDVSTHPDYVPNPFLADTEAEMAVPMLVGERLMGVIDVHAKQKNRFQDEDVIIQQTLAAQIAVTLQTAILYQDQLRTAEKLREVDRLKSEFLASMSHELRTPLNAIIGFAEVLLEGLSGELTERMTEDVTMIRNSGSHLRDLIGNILDMSKIEAGMMSIRHRKVDMNRMIKDIMGTASILAQEKGLGLEANVAPDVDYIYADSTRVKQVFLNIVGNAVKFTDKGKVTLDASIRGDDLYVEITDTGIGIKQEDLQIVFEQFRQIDTTLTQEVGGTGLGMPITKKLVELHGGEIGVMSEMGKGTTFWFTLPNLKEAPPRE